MNNTNDLLNNIELENILEETKPLEQRHNKFVTKKGGQIINIRKVSRNSLCYCGSKTKYKWCCGKNK